MRLTEAIHERTFFSINWALKPGVRMAAQGALCPRQCELDASVLGAVTLNLNICAYVRARDTRVLRRGCIWLVGVVTIDGTFCNEIKPDFQTVNLVTQPVASSAYQTCLHTPSSLLTKGARESA